MAYEPAKEMPRSRSLNSLSPDVVTTGCEPRKGIAKNTDRDSVSALPILYFLCGGIGRAPSAPCGIAGTSHDALGAALRLAVVENHVLTLSHFRNEPKTANPAVGNQQ
jgi:hypothetical protein